MNYMSGGFCLDQAAQGAASCSFASLHVDLTFSVAHRCVQQLRGSAFHVVEEQHNARRPCNLLTVLTLTLYRYPIISISFARAFMRTNLRLYFIYLIILFKST